MHIKVQRFSRLFTTLLVALCVPFLIKASVAASIVTVNGLNGNQAKITDSSGQVVSNTQDLDEYNYYQVSYKWSIPDSETIQPGDTVQFTLPSNVRIPSALTFDITDNEGNVVGHADIQANATTGTITFTNIPSSFRYNRHGTISFYVEGTTKENTDINTWMINKGGWIDDSTVDENSNPTQLYWNVVINPAGKNLSGVKFIDRPETGMKIIPDTVVVYTVGSNNQLDQKLSPTITVNDDGSMKIDLGDINTPIYVKYKTNLDSELIGSNVTKWENTGIVDWDNGNSSYTQSVVRHGGSGTEDGYNGSVELQKLDAINKQPLAGAIFELQNEAGDVLQTNLVTNSEGKITINNLVDGTYQFVETKAPDGYQLDSTPIQFTIDDSSPDTLNVKVSAINKRASSSSQSSSSSNSAVISSSSSKVSSSSVHSSSVSSSSESSSSSELSSSASSKPSVVSSSSSKVSSSSVHSSSVSSSSKSSSSSELSSSALNQVSSSSSQANSSEVSSSSAILSSEASSSNVLLISSSESSSLSQQETVSSAPAVTSSSMTSMSSSLMIPSVTLSSADPSVSEPTLESSASSSVAQLNSETPTSTPVQVVSKNEEITIDNQKAQSASSMVSSSSNSLATSSLKDNDKRTLPQTGENQTAMYGLMFAGLVIMAGIVVMVKKKH